MAQLDEFRPGIARAIMAEAKALVQRGDAVDQTLAEFQIVAEIDHAAVSVLAGLAADAIADGHSWPQIAAHSDGSNSEALPRRFRDGGSRKGRRGKFAPSGDRIYGLTEAMDISGVQRSTILNHIERDRQRRDAAGETGPSWWVEVPTIRGGVERLTPYVIDLDWITANIPRRPRKSKG